jgi:beta-fructofuranosidase
MLLHPSEHVGDAWYYVKEDMVHCFYLTTPMNEDLSMYAEIGHSISADLIRWDRLDLVLTREKVEALDEVYVAIGSVLYYADRYWLAYTSNTRNGSRKEAAVCLAVSDDLVRWEKVAYNPITRVDPLYYERWGSGGKQSVHWCCPFLFYHDGWVYHYVRACRRGSQPDRCGTLGLARTDDMVTWEVLPPPILEPILQSLDVPQLYHKDGLFYLVFFAHAHDFTRDFVAAHGSEPTSAMYSMVSPTPFGPFRIVGSGRILPATSPLQREPAQIVDWRGQYYLLSSTHNKEQNKELAPVQVQFTAAGIKALV